MDLSKYRNKLIGNEQERAVSPVIGVILMVAITVILAAVIAAFVMDMGDNLSDGGPTLDGEVTTNSDWDGTSTSSTEEMVYVSHNNGDTVEQADVEIILRDSDGSQIATMNADETVTVDGEDVSNNLQEDFSTGTTFTISTTNPGSNSELNPGDEITVQVVDTNTDTLVIDSSVELPS